PLAEAVRAAAAQSGPERRVTVPFLGGPYLVDFEARAITAPPGHRPAGFQKGLVLLAYLARAQDIGRSGRMVAARELNGGDMFFQGPHALLTQPVTARFGADPAGFVARAGALGLTPDQAGAGTAVRGPVLPHLEVGLILHPGDEEFPAELTYTFDAYAHYHLPLDAIWSLINVLAEELAA
ncbi:MAG: DUF3786 domain-containing protein, partial [Candidatus Adiutrix sp.]|nr:DUF3786 domain-containing protein [Candidatus Adiutrix sp.]